MLYKIFNGPMPTTSQQVAVTTGVATLKTLLQVKPIVPCKVVEWGISLDASAAAVPGIVELFESDVAATVTASVEADVTKFDGDAVQYGANAASYFTLSTTGTGYTASAEGTTTVARMGDVQQIAPTNQYVYQSPLGYRFYVQAAKFLRIRTKFPAAVSAICYVLIEV